MTLLVHLQTNNNNNKNLHTENISEAINTSKYCDLLSFLCTACAFYNGHFFNNYFSKKNVLLGLLTHHAGVNSVGVQ